MKQTKLNDTPEKPNTSIFITMIMVSLSLTTLSCGNKETQAKPGSENEEAVNIKPEVIFDIADKGELSYTVESQGIIEADKEFKIQPRISGFLQHWNMYDGKFVRAGDELVSFVDDEWKLSVKEAEDRFVKAQSDLAIEKKIRGNGEPNHDNNVELMLKNQSGYTQAEVNLERAKLTLSYTKIRAPFSGLIQTKLSYQQGQLINAGTDLGKLIDQTTARVRLEVLESEIGKIKTGMKVRISHAGNGKVLGSVISVSPIIDPNTKTGQVTVQFDNQDQKLKAGMTVEGLVMIESVSGKCRVPRSAVLDRDNRQLIFKLNGDEVEWIYVKPTSMNSEWAILDEDSVNPGDTIAVDQHFAISHLQKVSVKLK